MRARNTHTASVAGISPGEIGDVDPANEAIRIFMAAGWLVPVDAKHGDLRDRPSQTRGSKGR